MKRIALAAVATLALSAPALAQTFYLAPQPYSAYEYGVPHHYSDRGRVLIDDDIVTGSIAPAPGWGENFAAEGNAEQQNKPTLNYGGVSGGYLD
jgi:hypothetical protein